MKPGNRLKSIGANSCRMDILKDEEQLSPLRIL